MRFKSLSAAEKQRRRAKARQIKWQVVFAWWPARVSDTEVQWLCSVARKDRGLLVHSDMSFWERLIIKWNHWEYGPVTNALTQPGVIEDASNGISSAQVSGAAVQSRLGAALGQAGQVIQAPAYGNANAIYPPHGGLNSFTPKPGP